MGCYYPVGVYRKDGSPTKRPCGYCIGCRLENSRQWAMRCVHEAQMHAENSFITLTYNDDNLPEDKSINKKTMQTFVKKLREELYPKKIRYFGSAEYGEICETCQKSRKICYDKGCGKFKKSLGRPHYHLCIFNHEFPDKKAFFFDRKRWKQKFSTRGYDHTLYRSPLLEKIWKKGYSTVGELSFDSAGYCARYVTKKINGQKELKHYGDKSHEFALMSRNPGIGNQWIKKYLYDVYPKDYVHVNGKKMRPCRYYDSVLEKLKPKMYDQIKQKRRDVEENSEYESDWRLHQKAEHRKKITKPLERSYES